MAKYNPRKMSKAHNFKKQNYYSLKKEALATGVPFSDPLFPADNVSLFYSGNSSRLPGRVIWKRPKELCSTPRLFVDGITSCDVVQGSLGNCWFIAACSSLAQEKEAWHKVIPDYREQEQCFTNPHCYTGIFKFRFWQFGDWIEVVIDDRLPTVNGQLIYTHSHEKNEFWGPLLEKAYAKLMGSYEALEGGNLSDALVDFTGGISEQINLQKGMYNSDLDKQKKLFKTMMAEIEKHSLMCCAINAQNKEEMETRTSFGLVKGHAYGITAVKSVYIGDTGLISFFKGREKIFMVRLRNPWGGHEWTGPFSDGSPEWSKISESERQRIGLTFEEDGEFWMPFEDFCTHFTDLSMCLLVNTSWFSFSKSWHEMSLYGRWTTGVKGSKYDNAGGCISNEETFLRNPQYRFDITGEMDSIMIYLLQKDKRNMKKDNIKNCTIGFSILKVESNRKYKVHKIQNVIENSDYIRTRGVFKRLTLHRGRYVVIPTTFNPGEENEFLLRIFTGKDANVKKMTKEMPKHSFFPCISYPCAITAITIRKATGLEKRDLFASCDPYCIIKCEGAKVRTHTCCKTLNPEWNFSAIFYRKKIQNPIIIEIWNHNILKDTFMGLAIVEAPVSSNDTISYSLSLYEQKNCVDTRPGKLEVTAITSDVLKEL
ncbi:calpain-5-like isoform X3 [Centruroides sculpturatus]|uniref:calpain-5-like isoform X3 n=1 Tax=Centruroides sculpturatus TaxID=218467 RepID=UPI000C6E37AD|nr:calpain-5-like isoform X3 [Centruroides sculpturatus]